MKNTMRKTNLLFLAFAFLLTVINVASAAEVTHVGIVTGLESGTFHLINQSGEVDLVKGAKLYPGDMVKKPAAAKAPEIMWWPYAGWKDPAAAEQLEVSFLPPAPQEQKGFLQNVKSFLGFVETDYASVHGVADETKEMQRENKYKDVGEEGFAPQSPDSTHDSLSENAVSPSPSAAEASSDDSSSRMESGAGARLQPNRPAGKIPPAKPRKTSKDFLQPGLNVTLVPGVPVEFRAAASPAPRFQLFFRKPDSTIGLKKPFAGSLLIKPEEIGLAENEAWTWELAGTPSLQGKIRIMSPEFVTKMRADLATLQTEIPEIFERKVKTAAYLQFLSDTYPGDVNLYWLSLRMLDGLKIPAENVQLAALREKLHARALDHFQREQSQP